MEKFDILSIVESNCTFLDNARSAFETIHMKMEHDLLVAEAHDMRVAPKYCLQLSDGLSTVRRELDRIAVDLRNMVDEAFEDWEG